MDVWMHGYVFVWMYGCMGIWPYGRTDVWVYVCMDVWVYVCIYIYICMYIYTHTEDLCKYVLFFVLMYECMYACMHVWIHVSDPAANPSIYIHYGSAPSIQVTNSLPHLFKFPIVTILIWLPQILVRYSLDLGTLKVKETCVSMPKSLAAAAATISHAFRIHRAPPKRSKVLHDTLPGKGLGHWVWEGWKGVQIIPKSDQHLRT